jgi:hypothetical protein
VIEWSRALDVRLSEWCCSVSMVWVQIRSREEQKFDYTCLYTCRMSISRFALREKVTLGLLKLLLKGVDVVEWSRALDVRLSEWCCSASMMYQWCGFKSGRGKNKI